MSRTHYEVLDVSPAASPDEIKRAYRTLAGEFHPDKAAGLSAAQKALFDEQMKSVNAAYSCLSDPMQRAAYDLSLRLGGARGAGGGAERTGRLVDRLVGVLEEDGEDLLVEGARAAVRGVRRYFARK